MEHFQRICQIEEVELHVDWGGRVLPGLKGFCAVLQDCSLKQEKSTSAAGAIMLHGTDRREEFYALGTSTGSKTETDSSSRSRSALLWSSSLNINQARHLLSWPQARGSTAWFVVPLLPTDNCAWHFFQKGD